MTIYYRLRFYVIMQKQQLDKLKTWFDKYVAVFYGDDDFVNVHLRLKEDHSRRTCQEIL